MKGTALIMLALFIDGIQAAFSAGIFILSAFPGTFGGAAAGCAAGNAVAGSAGCSVGGFLLGLIGSIPLINGIFAIATVPVGVVLGFAISICLSATLGAGLIMLLIICGMYYPKYILPGGITEFIPGFDLIPSWTAMTILCVLQDNKKRGGVLGAAVGVASAVTSPSVSSVSGAARAMDGIRSPANDNRPPSVQSYAA